MRTAGPTSCVRIARPRSRSAGRSPPEHERTTATGIAPRQQVRAATRAASDDTTFAIDRERARLRSAGVDAHDERSGHQGWWIAPPETARDAPVALGRLFGFPCMR